MVWQHDNVNRLMDHQTNVGGGWRTGEGRRGGEIGGEEEERGGERRRRVERRRGVRRRGEECARARQQMEEPDKPRWIMLIDGRWGPINRLFYSICLAKW